MTDPWGNWASHIWGTKMWFPFTLDSSPVQVRRPFNTQLWPAWPLSLKTAGSTPSVIALPSTPSVIALPSPTQFIMCLSKQICLDIWYYCQDIICPGSFKLKDHSIKQYKYR